MHGPRSSFARAWYRFRTRSRLAANEWQTPYFEEQNGQRLVPCRRCPKLDPQRSECRVPFGSPLRKCVVAATEAHLRATRGLQVLELGYARRSYGKQIIEASGGTWTGIEPLIDPAERPELGRGGYGHAGAIPFPDGTFDLIFGNQSFEHWEEPLPNGAPAPSYQACLEEIRRALKPGGSLYLDAPIHLHGHEMFVAGDIDRILGLFDRRHWRDVVAERWREKHDPLPRYPTPAADIAHVHGTIKSYDSAMIADLQQHGSVWLLVVTAKRAA